MERREEWEVIKRNIKGMESGERGERGKGREEVKMEEL